MLGGGRYDGLMGVMGGPETPGVGWAAGIERLALLIAEPPSPPRPVALVPLGAAGRGEGAARWRTSCARAGFAVDLGYSGNLRRRLQRANKINARAAVILGDDELARGVAALRDLDSGEQIEVPLDALEGAARRLPLAARCRRDAELSSSSASITARRRRFARRVCALVEARPTRCSSELRAAGAARRC